MDVVSCPLLTARHAHHSAVWCVTGYSFPKLCIACATERLENHSKGELSIHIKKILGEFQALLSSAAHACNSSEQSFFSVLSTDSRVVEHLCGLLFGEKYTISLFHWCMYIVVLLLHACMLFMRMYTICFIFLCRFATVTGCDLSSVLTGSADDSAGASQDTGHQPETTAENCAICKINFIDTYFL